MDSRGGLRARCLTSRYPQVPGSPYQWPTDEPYSVIASKELGRCETMLGKEHLSTFRCLGLIRVLDLIRVLWGSFGRLGPFGRLVRQLRLTSRANPGSASKNYFRKSKRT